MSTVNLGNLNGEYYFSDTTVVDKIVSFIPRSRSFSRLYCPTAGDGAVAKAIAADYKHCNDITTRHHAKLIEIADTVTHDDARYLELEPFDLIVDNLPLYLYEQGRNVCADILKAAYNNLAKDGVLIITLPHNFFKKQYNRDAIASMRGTAHLITKEDLPILRYPIIVFTVGI